MSKTKSILLQVAFKEAAKVSAMQGLFDIPSVDERTQGFYETLIALHEKYGLSVEDAKRGGGGNYSGGTSAPKRSTSNDAGTSFEVDGTEWLDFRAAKDSNSVKPNFPDFKTADGSTSLWLVDKEGNANAEAVALAKAADVSASLSS